MQELAVPLVLVLSVAATIMYGTLLAIAYIVVRGGAAVTFQRYFMLVKTLFRTQQVVYVKPEARDALPLYLSDFGGYRRGPCLR